MGQFPAHAHKSAKFSKSTADKTSRSGAYIVSSEPSSRSISQPFFCYQVDHCWIYRQAGWWWTRKLLLTEVRQSIRYWLIAFLLLLAYVTLWPRPLTF